MPYQYKSAINRYFRNICFHVVVTPTPPITFIETAAYLKQKCKAKVYLILRDIFPQNAKDLGLIKSKFIFNYFRRKEKKLYQIADFIGCMSQKNVDYVNHHNPEVNRNKLHLLPNWIKVEEIILCYGNLRKKYNLENKIVAVFGGNLGKPQNIDLILNLAKLYLSNNKVIFLIIGNGTEKNRISKRICDEKIFNIVHKCRMPRQEYLELLAECDIGLVNLHPSFTIPNIPSRTLAYFQAKIPVLAAVDRATDLGDLIETSKAGLWCYSDDLNSYKDNFELLLNNSKI